MAQGTKIQWTDRTWNPLRGCTRVSEGCRHCYAETLAGRFAGHGQAYEGLVKITVDGPRWTNTIRLLPDKLREPMAWREPAMVFVNSTSDLFHPDVPFEFIDQVYAVMALSAKHTFQVLTKRPGRAAEYFQFHATRHKWGVAAASLTGKPAKNGDLNDCDMSVCNAPYPLPNVWIGTSVEDQHTANTRIDELLRCPAAARFVSYEPALGPLDFLAAGAFGEFIPPGPRSIGGGRYSGEALQWIIVGGESGPGARPFNLCWAYDTVKQCKDAGVACFVKQMGAVPHFRERPLYYKDKKGGDITEWPEDLRVREFPEVAAQ